ncbi:MAG TPA: cation:proton antiporter [Mariprofundaceae bacterium]|nr:cation:proton antiporter [Mariprofundaceae bacterium]
MGPATSPTETFVVAVLVAVTAQMVAARIRFPAIFFWLVAGMALGPYGLHVLQVESLQPALHTLIELGLAVILFEGGLNLNLKALQQHGRVVSLLLVFGPLLNMLIGGGALHLISGLDWPVCLLFGTLVSVGGPTVIMPILRQVRLNRSISAILASEAMLVDAVGAILAIVMLEVVITPEITPGWLARVLLTKFLTGGAVGFACGWLLSKALASEQWLKDMELRTIATLAAVWGIFMLADSLSSQAGLLAVLVAGATMQRMELPDIQRLRHFKGSLSVLLISLLFVLLAANLNLPMLWDFTREGLLLFVILALLVRPLTAWLSSLGSNLPRKHVLFIGAIAPRGVVAAAIASLFAIILQGSGRTDGQMLQSLVYIIIIVSVMVYGFLAAPFSRWLDVRGADDRSVLIIGGGHMGVELARVLGGDREVRFIDLNAEAVATMQRGGYLAVRGNALDPLYMEITHAEEVSSVLVMTGSSDHNLLIARMARDEFHVPEVYVTLQEEDGQKHARLIHQLQARRLFASPYNYSYWNAEIHRKKLVHENRTIEPDSPLIGRKLSGVRITAGVQPLAIIRKGKSLIPHDDIVLQEADEICMLVRPERVQEGQPLILPPVSDNSVAEKGQRLPG